MSGFLRCWSLSALLFLSALAGRDSLAADLIANDARVSLIHDLQIPAKESGELAELLVHEGSRVKTGELLGRIDQSLQTLQSEAATLQSEIAQLQSENDVNLRFARKSSEVSRAESQRFEEAVAAYANAISKSELDEARLVAERSELSIEQAEVELKAARLNNELRDRERDIANQHVANAQIKAPISGMIVEVYRQPGEWAQVGQPIVRVIDLEKLRIEAFLGENDCNESTVGKPVIFRTNTAGADARDFEGTVVFVSPEINPVTGQVRVWAEVDNIDGALRPGAKGQLIIRQ